MPLSSVTAPLGRCRGACARSSPSAARCRPARPRRSAGRLHASRRDRRRQRVVLIFVLRGRTVSILALLLCASESVTDAVTTSPVRRCRSRSAAASIGASRSPAVRKRSSEVRDQHRDDQQRADDPGLGVASTLARPSPLRRLSTMRIDRATPSMRARAAEDADPAEQHHRDDVELESLGRGCRGPSPAWPRTAPRRAPATDRDAVEQDQLDAGDTDPGVAGDLGVVADDVDVAAEARCAARTTPATTMPTKKTSSESGSGPTSGVLAEVVEPARESRRTTGPRPGCGPRPGSRSGPRASRPATAARSGRRTARAAGRRSAPTASATTIATSERHGAALVQRREHGRARSPSSRRPRGRSRR